MDGNHLNLTVRLIVASETVTTTYTLNVVQKKIAKYLLMSIPPILFLVLAVRVYYNFDLGTQLLASFYSQTDRIHMNNYREGEDVREHIRGILDQRRKYSYQFCHYLRGKLFENCCKHVCERCRYCRIKKCESIRERQRLHDQSLARLMRDLDVVNYI